MKKRNDHALDESWWDGPERFEYVNRNVISKVQNENLFKFVKLFAPIQKGLHIGGTFINEKRSNWELEIAPLTLILNINYGVNPNVCADAKELPFSTATFGYIVSFHTFEHIKGNPKSIPKEWIRVLVPGGLLGLVMPDKRYFLHNPDVIKNGECAYHEMEPNELYELFQKLDVDILFFNMRKNNFDFEIVARKKGEISKINTTAKVAYTKEGAGIGTGEEAAKRYPPDIGSFVLDVGFGDCKLVKNIIDKACIVYGIDIAKDSSKLAQKERLSEYNFVPLFLDISHERIPLIDDFFDWAYCLETIEHLSNPFFAIAEIKRVLKHNGKLVITFPMPEKNLGYEGGKHAHVYPGFLQRDSFERFMIQLYFKLLERNENGDTAWYLFQNIKNDPRMVDIFDVIAENYSEKELYDWINNG